MSWKAQRISPTASKLAKSLKNGNQVYMFYSVSIQNIYSYLPLCKCLGLLDLDLTLMGEGVLEALLLSYLLGGDLFLQILGLSLFSLSTLCWSLSRSIRSRDFSLDLERFVLSHDLDLDLVRFLDEERCRIGDLLLNIFSSLS